MPTNPVTDSPRPFTEKASADAIISALTEKDYRLSRLYFERFLISTNKKIVYSV